ncbi:MAG TPA: protein kinase [Anaerolineales bacterium]|nr:protein kinase [Anaerolineales bacterium]
MATLTGQVVGHYQILERVGQGGMATIYKAYDPVEGRNVAVKVLSSLAADSPQFTARFQREAKVVSELRHPNIVPVLDFGEDDGKHYLVMPLIEMGSLADRLMSGPLKPRESGRVVKQVAEALDYAHQHGVVHRDIKPSNILLDEDGNALVSDFGLVYILDATVSLTGSALIGTPAYMSPEQARGEKVTPATDQYAFGIVLYELATGELPYDGETPMAVAIRHITDPIPFPRERNAHVPETIERVILRATAKDPGDRFASMAALGEAFHGALAYALDPTSNPPSMVDLPDSVLNNHPTVPLEEPERRPNRRVMALALLATAMLLGLLFCPAGSLRLPGILERLSSSAEGTGLTVADLSEPQLTAMAGTLEVMSTQLAEAQGTQFNPDEMQTAVVGSFLGTQEAGTPGPLVFGGVKSSSTPTGGPPGEGSATAASNSTAPPTPTDGPTVPGAPSATPFPSVTAGGLPSATSPLPTLPLPTATLPGPLTSPPPPTATRTPTITVSSTLPPTWTMTPTRTASPAPTATFTLDPCLNLSLSAGSTSGKNVEWELGNGGPTTITITVIWIDWPTQNDKLNKVRLAGSTIWDQSDDVPPSEIDSNWKGASRQIPPGGSETLTFEFKKNAAATGYSVDVTLDNGCVVSANR